MAFQIGDVVQLKSGGPSMTVVEVNSASGKNIRTSWFAGAKHEMGYFPPDALVPGKEKEKEKAK